MPSSITMSTSTIVRMQESALLQSTQQVGLRVRADQRGEPDHRRVRWLAFEDSKQGDAAVLGKRKIETPEKALVQQK